MKGTFFATQAPCVFISMDGNASCALYTSILQHRPNEGFLRSSVVLLSLSKAASPDIFLAQHDHFHFFFLPVSPRHQKGLSRYFSFLSLSFSTERVQPVTSTPFIESLPKYARMAIPFSSPRHRPAMERPYHRLFFLSRLSFVWNLFPFHHKHHTDCRNLLYAFLHALLIIIAWAGSFFPFPPPPNSPIDLLLWPTLCEKRETR